MRVRSLAQAYVERKVNAGLSVPEEKPEAYYREHRQAVRQMTLICTLGGIAFIGLRVINIVEGIVALNASPVPESLYLPPFIALLLAVGIDVAVGIVALRISSWFRTYSRPWDLRLEEAARSGEALRKAMEQG